MNNPTTKYFNIKIDTLAETITDKTPLYKTMVGPVERRLPESMQKGYLGKN